MDKEGYLRVVGRIKDMIVRGGENIYPLEIENFLHKHPKISDVHVSRVLLFAVSLVRLCFKDVGPL